MNKKERVFRIGRARDCDIVLADESVSRYHAELSYLADGKLFLTDCHSANGTSLVDGRRQTPVRQTLLSPTETVRFGDVAMSVKELLEAIRLKFPGFYSGPVEPPSSEDSDSRQPWVRGERLVRCQCGAVKPRDQTCPTCGQ